MDDCDKASEREQKWLSGLLDEVAYQTATNQAIYGRECKYCGDEIQIERVGITHYCCPECCSDYSVLMAAKQRRGGKQ